MIIYLFPLLIDFVVGAFTTLAVLYSLHHGASYTFVGVLLGMVPAGVYGLSAYCAGRVIGALPLRATLVTATLATLVVCLLQLFLLDYRWTAVMLVLLSLALGFFFVPFQVMLMQRRPMQDRARLAALYNLSWSGGYCLGPWIAGLMLQVNRVHAYLVPVAVLVVLLGVYVVLWKWLAEGPASANSQAIPPTSKAANCDDKGLELIERFLPVGWSSAFIYCILFAYTKTVYIKTASFRFDLTDGQMGMLIGLQSASLAAISVIFLVWPGMSYRRVPVVIFDAILIAGAALLIFCRSLLELHLAFVLVGIFGGYAIFSAVTYSGSHPTRRARCIGINELLFGMGSMLGPLITGLLSEKDPKWASGFVLVGVLAAVIWRLWWIFGRPIPATHVRGRVKI